MRPSGAVYLLRGTELLLNVGAVVRPTTAAQET
jgi:hypothetical protein